MSRKGTSTAPSKNANKATAVDLDALQKILDSGNEKQLMKFFQGMPEATRRECFPTVKNFWSKIRKNRFIEDPPGTFSWNPRDGVSRVAFFATATGSEILKAKRQGYPDDDHALEILSDRRPDWAQQWIESLLGETAFWMKWRLIRRAMEAGLVKKPDTPRYYLAMISGINRRMSKTNLVEELERSPDLLEHDVWKLFEYDGDGENSLANTERFDKSWIEAFLKLIKKGKLPRAKMMESSVEALERDFNHYRAKWYYDFFDRLEPTDAELKKYSQRILGLLGASAPNVASWAFGYVERFAKADLFDTATLCHAVKPLLRARVKGNVLSVLKVLQNQAELHPKSKSDVASTVALALAHDSADVQKAAFKTLGTLSTPDDKKIRDTLEELQPTMAASVRKQVSQWLASGSKSAETQPSANSTKSANAARSAKPGTPPVELPKLSKQVESLYAIDALRKNAKDGLLAIPAAIFDGTDIPRLVHTQPIEPITTIEELIDVSARVIEDGSLVDDAERCIDAFARLADKKPDDLEALTAPLLKRVRKLIKKDCSPFCAVGPHHDVMGLFYALATGIVIEPKFKGERWVYDFEGEKQEEYRANATKPIGLLSTHCQAVAKRMVTGGSSQRLSAPTHTGGWIDPHELAKRVNAWTGEAPDVADVVLCILRLAPENRAAALKSIKSIKGEWVDAIRYALHADGVSIGSTAAYWIAAARARSPWKDDCAVEKKFPNLGPDTGRAAKVTFQCKTRKSGPYTFRDSSFVVEPKADKKMDPLLVTVTFFAARDTGLSFEMGGFGGRTAGAVRWTATIWPMARESFFIASTVVCFNNLDWWEAEWQNRTMLEPLIDSGTPLRYAGLLFLCGMLAAKEPGESGLATDIAIRAIEDGRLGSDNLGEGLSTLLSFGLIKPGRWQKTLAEVARTSPLHAAVIRLALERCFENTKQELPKDAGKLVELMYELSEELNLPIVSEPCRQWLASGAATGKSAKIAKSLLAMNESDSKEVIRGLLEQAIAARCRSA